MLVFVIFLFCDLLMAGVFFAVYGRKPVYEEGMLLGVHLPREAAQGAEVTALTTAYRRRTRRFYLVNLLLGVAVCLVAFWRFSPSSSSGACGWWSSWWGPSGSSWAPTGSCTT